MKKRVLSILGSTGSIGRQTLEIARALEFPVAALAFGGSSLELFLEQVNSFKPQIAAVFDEKAAEVVRKSLSGGETRVLSGEEGLVAAAACPQADMVLSAIVGIAGLRPTMAAIEAGKDVALANKEVLVTAGELVMPAVKRKNVRLLPVDSEHSAIFQCLEGNNDKTQIKKIILTASGGPFFGKTRQQLLEVTPRQALKHPNWSMGRKISIDSATLMNKGLEFIEAMWLFDLPPEKIEIIVHRESIIHSMVEYNDGAVLAQLGTADMRGPIQFALTYPERVSSLSRSLDFSQLGSLTFAKPDSEVFSCLAHCITAAGLGKTAPAAVNGANEEAVSLFLSGKISFLGIGELVGLALKEHENKEIRTLEDVYAADETAREFVRRNFCSFAI